MVPFGPCPTVAAGRGIPAAWLEPGSDLDPALVARASRLTAVSMDMTGGYAASVRHHAPQAEPIPQPSGAVRAPRPHHPQAPRRHPRRPPAGLGLSNARAEALNNKVKLIVRRAYGFHSARAALALILLACGPVTLTLPHERPVT
jgi:hypothetical protein